MSRYYCYFESSACKDIDIRTWFYHLFSTLIMWLCSTLKIGFICLFETVTPGSLKNVAVHPQNLGILLPGSVIKMLKLEVFGDAIICKARLILLCFWDLHGWEIINTKCLRLRKETNNCCLMFLKPAIWCSNVKSIVILRHINGILHIFLIFCIKFFILLILDHNIFLYHAVHGFHFSAGKWRIIFKFKIFFFSLHWFENIIDCVFTVHLFIVLITDFHLLLEIQTLHQTHLR